MVRDTFVAQATADALPAYGLLLTDEQTTSSAFSALRRSDHDVFWQEGIPAIMVTDTAEFRYPAYHCRDGDDVVENLDADFATAVLGASVAGVATSLGMRAR